MIYICCRSVPNKLSLTEAALAVASLFPDESNSVYFEKIKSRIEESAKDSLYAYTVLGEMISNHFPAANQADNPLILSRNENGKPYFINSKLKFSISHSKGVVACALSDGEEIGVDVETATFSPEKAQKLSKRYFTVEDQNKIAQDGINFSRIWTQYEAAAKLMGINLADFISFFCCLQGNCHLHLCVL